MVTKVIIKAACLTSCLLAPVADEDAATAPKRTHHRLPSPEARYVLSVSSSGGLALPHLLPRVLLLTTVRIKRTVKPKVIKGQLRAKLTRIRGFGPGRTRPRRPARRPDPSLSFYHWPRLLPPPGDRRLIPLGGPPGLTCSRRARSATASPPSSGYPAYPTPRPAARDRNPRN